MIKCAGQDQRFWKFGDIFEIQCPQCGKPVEFFKDEAERKCLSCKTMVANPKLALGCAQWCQYAEQCLGPSFGKQVVNITRNKLIDEMKTIFGSDQKRIRHALTVLDYAERIQAAEGGNPLTVKAAAILHDIGIHQAEKKYGSAQGHYQEIEGPPIAREILKKHNLPADVTEHICKIIANHHSGKNIDTLEFRIIWDADWLTNIPDDFPDADRAELQKMIDTVFKTSKGRQIATETFIKN